MGYHTMKELDLLFPNNAEVTCAAIKMDDYLNDAPWKKYVCSISGGSDSDIMIDMIEKLGGGEGRVIYAFINTGLEYDATRRHIEFLKQKYGVEIIERRAKVPIPVSCRKYGLPFISKEISEKMERLQRKGFQWEDEPLGVLVKRYPKCRASLRWWCNDFGEKSRFNINRNKYLKEFIMQNPPDFPISQKCCEGAKKSTAHVIEEELQPDLMIVGVRRSEGGQRATTYRTCFSPANDKHIAQFRPIFYMSDKDKKEYEDFCGVVHSDCYTKYGMIRTGCACCPFGSRFEEELEIVKAHEPNLYRAANAIFGKSYEYTRAYRKFKEEMEQAEREKRRKEKAAG